MQVNNWLLKDIYIPSTKNSKMKKTLRYHRLAEAPVISEGSVFGRLITGPTLVFTRVRMYTSKRFHKPILRDPHPSRNPLSIYKSPLPYPHPHPDHHNLIEHPLITTPQ